MGPKYSKIALLVVRPLHELPVQGVDLDLVPNADELRHLDLEAGVRDPRFGRR